MINELLATYKLPPLPETREEMRDILQREMYGTMPTDPYTWEVSAPRDIECRYADFDVREVTLSVHVRGRDFSWPVKTALHRDGVKRPFFIVNNFRPDFPDRYLPVEEILDNGFDLLWFCYKDVTSDDGDFTNGLADIFVGTNDREPTAPGKLILWAWANSRVMDYALTLPMLDGGHGAVVGHSRLGKTSLVTGLFDDRFRYVISNNAGCAGESAARITEGEKIADITKNFPFWFCPNCFQYAGHHEAMPFDQHFLLAAQYPKNLIVGGSILDTWCDTRAQYLTLCAASPFYEKNGKSGFVHPDRLPETGEHFHDGTIGFHIKPGEHSLFRRDWLEYMDYIRKQL